MDNVEAGGKRKGQAAGKTLSPEIMAKRAAKREGKVGGKAGGQNKADGAAPKSPELQVARLVLRALWRQEWTAANPDKKAAERTTAWKEARQAHYEAELKKMRRALVAVKRDGVTLLVSEKAAKAEKGAGDDE